MHFICFNNLQFFLVHFICWLIWRKCIDKETVKCPVFALISIRLCKRTEFMMIWATRKRKDSLLIDMLQITLLKTRGKKCNPPKEMQLQELKLNNSVVFQVKGTHSNIWLKEMGHKNGSPWMNRGHKMLQFCATNQSTSQRSGKPGYSQNIHLQHAGWILWLHPVHWITIINDTGLCVDGDTRTLNATMETV